MTHAISKVETIQFHNQSLIVLNHQNKPYVAMKPICENIGLDWHAQRQRIHRHQVLSKGEVIITSPSKSGDQQYLCLPISMINGWLFGIDTNRVKPEIRPNLEQYQLECFDVLYNHFMPKVAKQFPNTITIEQQQAIKQAVNQRAFRTGEHYQAIYSKLYEQFKIPRYQDLPSSKFDDAIKFLGGILFTQNVNITESNLNCLIKHSLWIYNFWQENRLYRAFTLLGSNFGAEMHNHIGSCYTLSIGLKKELDNSKRLITSK